MEVKIDNCEKKNSSMVSIMMPVYNGEKTIEVAIRSILIQTYTNWQCVIINDCSTDSTQQILAKYCNDTRFKIIHLKENKGRGNARQLAINNADGQYLAFLDADDFYHPEKIHKQVEILEKAANISLVSVGIGSFDLNKNLSSLRGIGNNKIQIYKDSCFLPSFSPASVMLHLSLVTGIDYNPKLNVGEDFDFLIRYLRKNKNYYMMEDVMYFYEEVGAVKASKLIQYQILSLKALLSIYKRNKLLLFVHLSTKILKIIYYLAYIPIFGVNGLISKRGSVPNSIILKEYKSVLNQVSNI